MKRYYFEIDGFEVGEFFVWGNISAYDSLQYKKSFAKLHGISMYGLSIKKGTKK